jgi:hypothetical protein
VWEETPGGATWARFLEAAAEVLASARVSRYLGDLGEGF